jgi:hypothetical protein
MDCFSFVDGFRSGGCFRHRDMVLAQLIVWSSGLLWHRGWFWTNGWFGIKGCFVLGIEWPNGLC